MSNEGKKNLSRVEPDSEDVSAYDRLIALRDRYWRRLQDCFDLISQLPDKLSQFLVRVEFLPEVREKFFDVLDRLQDLSLKHSDFETNVAQLESNFDNLYTEIIANAREHARSDPIKDNKESSPIQRKELSIRDIQLPRFDGAPEKFPAFKAIFDAVVHNTNYSDIEKFTILLNNLQDSALKFAQTVRFSPENYSLVYDQIVKRYTNKRIIANHYLGKIFSLVPLKNYSFDALSELCETLQTNVTALKEMKISDLSDYIFVQVSLRLLDEKTRSEFEKQCLGTDFPTFENLIEFLRNKCSVSQLVGAGLNWNKQPHEGGSGVPNLRGSNPSKLQVRKVSMTSQHIGELNKNSIQKKCLFCAKSDHTKLFQCSKFKALPLIERRQFVKVHKLCYACLNPHFISQCKLEIKCQYCASSRHNGLLHPSPIEGQPSTSVHETNATSLVNSCSSEGTNVSLLGTARAVVKGRNGVWYPCRVVLDSGSQVNFITVAMANILKLSRRRCEYEVVGVGGMETSRVLGKINCCLSSLYESEFTLSFDAVVLPRITTNLPTVSLPPNIKKEFHNLRLADPEFNVSSPVDILLGVQALLDITPSESVIRKGSPTAYFTRLGWVIMGNVQNCVPSISHLVSNVCVAPVPSLNELLEKFWETEEVDVATALSPEDEICENYYSKTVKRNKYGRYVVSLPFKMENPVLGCTRELALNRFLKLENRFRRDGEFHRLYSENMADYIDQGHLVPASTVSPYIMTHHGVSKQSSDGVKVRVVFSPAEKDENGQSLNEMLYSGPRLHQDISVILSRFRLHPVALTCDICQMFRCILMAPEDRKYFHIFWRFHPNEPLTEWEHTRVIFGSTSSPYLAMRTLKQLVQDEGANFPLASRALNLQTFVDDILTGGETEEQVEQMRNQLVELLKRGGFELGKWACSSTRVIADSGRLLELPMGNVPSSVKVLGMYWDIGDDVFRYRVQDITEPATKRGILSRVARTYDINGYLSPFTFMLKCWIQRLWHLKIGWDEPLPPDILEKWLQVRDELLLIEQIRIPRCIWGINVSSGTLVGFSDASLLGMASVVYLRLKIGNQYLVNLVAAKTRVAPLKSWTIPRLELGAACLLSKLMKVTMEALQTHVDLTDPICFVDSTTALGWIRTPPYRLKTFVANRVVQIQENISNAIWRFVPGELNPADVASRGLTPSELLRCHLWWRGAEFLRSGESEWGFRGDIPLLLPETKEIPEFSLISQKIEERVFSEVLERVPSLPKAQRVLAYVLRFCRNWILKRRKVPRTEWHMGPLKAKEYDSALLLSIRFTQRQHYAKEFRLLEQGLICSKEIRGLSPFISEEGFLMVGGRLRHSQLPAGTKHPYLIPKGSRLATLICDYYHIYSGHGGPRLVHSLINRSFWIPNIRRLIRSRIFRCLTCYRFKAVPIQPPMGDLPAYRLEPGRCFTHTGLDFAGPFEVKLSNLKGQRFQKCYVALFVCMVSRAIHMEMVSSLTTEACLAAIDRFISRRGLPSDFYSDMGTNFRGAAREFSEIRRYFEGNSDMSHYLATHGISWHHNPPYAPHMGGLWEAGVKAFKHHFKRILGNSKLHLEGFMTTMNRIEAILNSRPFCNQSSSPEDDLDPLTPGHFLTGGPLLARHEYALSDVPTNRLTQWQLSQRLVQSFWKRWAKEYVSNLQNRPKWTKPARDLKEGELVLWYSPHAPPTHWPIGRIISLVKGADGIARVARVKTSSGEVLRPLNKLAPLPPP